MKPLILLTNDDGIRSRFLHAIANALDPFFEIVIAAPKCQQSWIGRAVTRNGKVQVISFNDLQWPSWQVDGTPTDCVNIALSSLLERRPAAIVSGINVGYNTTTPLIYSSGTVAGALEGAFWGLPAFALSQQIPDDIFMEAAYNDGALPPEWRKVLDEHARHASGFIHDKVTSVADSTAIPGDAIVHNLNYPAYPRQPLRISSTVPAPMGKMSFFQKEYEDGYEFRFNHGIPKPSVAKTDREALDEGLVSHSILNFSSLGRDLIN